MRCEASVEAKFQKCSRTVGCPFDSILKSGCASRLLSRCALFLARRVDGRKAWETTSTRTMPKSKKSEKVLIKQVEPSNHAKTANSQIDTSQVSKAVHALLAYVKKQKEAKDLPDLIDEEQMIWLTVTTKKISDAVKLKPTRM
jgi:hypothetical protein